MLCQFSLFSWVTEYFDQKNVDSQKLVRKFSLYLIFSQTFQESKLGVHVCNQKSPLYLLICQHTTTEMLTMSTWPSIGIWFSHLTLWCPVFKNTILPPTFPTLSKPGEALFFNRAFVSRCDSCRFCGTPCGGDDFADTGRILYSAYAFWLEWSHHSSMPNKCACPLWFALPLFLLGILEWHGRI